LDHGQLIAPHDVTSTSSTDELTFPRRTVAEMMDPVMLAAVNIQLSEFCGIAIFESYGFGR